MTYVGIAADISHMAEFILSHAGRRDEGSKNMLIDTHCHLDFPDFKDDLDSVLKRAEEAGVGRVINVASSLEGSKKGSELSLKYPAIYASVGVHPHDAAEISKSDIRVFEKIAKENKKIVAIGEVGLDFYRDLSPHEAQENLFSWFIELSGKLNLPLIIHSRDAFARTVDILKEENPGKVSGVMHCFSGDKTRLKQALDLGLHVSFTCNVTYKNASRLRETAKYAPLDRLLLETDAPFLAPESFRGKRNEPAYLSHLVKALSAILGVSEKEIEEVTTQNADRLFGLGLGSK